MRCNHHEDEKRPCTCVDTYNAIVAGENIPKLAGYCAIVREAAKQPEYLTCYASDLLVWDRATLTDYAGPFLWVLRDCGTQLVRPGDWKGSTDAVTAFLHAFGDKCRWYWFDGETLHHVRTAERARQLLQDEERRAS